MVLMILIALFLLPALHTRYVFCTDPLLPGGCIPCLQGLAYRVADHQHRIWSYCLQCSFASELYFWYIHLYTVILFPFLGMTGPCPVLCFCMYMSRGLWTCCAYGSSFWSVCCVNGFKRWDLAICMTAMYIWSVYQAAGPQRWPCRSAFTSVYTLWLSGFAVFSLFQVAIH